EAAREGHDRPTPILEARASNGTPHYIPRRGATINPIHPGGIDDDGPRRGPGPRDRHRLAAGERHGPDAVSVAHRPVDVGAVGSDEPSVHVVEASELRPRTGVGRRAIDESGIREPDEVRPADGDPGLAIV